MQEKSIFTRIIEGEIPCHKIAQKIQAEMKPIRVGVVVEGFGVPHAHIHLVPLYDKNVLQLHHGYPAETTPEELAKIAQKITFEK